MSLQWCAEAGDYVQELFNEGKPSVDYVLFQLEDPKKRTPRMELLSMGKGGRSKVEELLLSETSTDQVITGAFLASAIDERGSVVSVRRKYIHVIWVGTRVGIMVKGKVNTQLNQKFKDQFPGCAHYVQLSDGDCDELQPNILEKTLLAAGGAHKPTRYSFTNRTLIGSLNMDDSSYNNANAQRQREEEEQRLRALEAARRKAAAEEAKRRAAEEAKRAAEEEARRKAEADARRKAEEERLQAEEERMKLLEAQEQERKAREEEARRKEEEARQKAEDERLANEAERMKQVEAQERERKAREEEARRKAYEEEQALKKAAMTPKQALSDKSLIMLISSMSGNLATSTNQARAQSILKSLDVVPEIVDGAEPTMKDRRNELFSISGMRGAYPQFFLRQADGTLKFFGDFETFAHYHESGVLAQQLGGCATPQRNAKSNNNPNAASMTSTLNGNKLLLLVSSMSGSLEVSANQNRVEGILKGLHLPKEEIEIMDGCEPTVKDRRNELFGISGIRAKYPQLFLVNGNDGSTSFVGNFDDICYLHDTNTFAQAIGLVSSNAAPTVMSTLNGSKLLLLISSMPGSMEVTSNQSRVEGILKGLHLSPGELEVLDGCDAALKDRRNELFGISGIRAKYPQLFLVGQDGVTRFIGNYDDICLLHDTNTLGETIGLTSVSGPGASSSAPIPASSEYQKEPPMMPESEVVPPETPQKLPAESIQPTESVETPGEMPDLVDSPEKTTEPEKSIKDTPKQLFAESQQKHFVGESAHKSEPIATIDSETPEVEKVSEPDPEVAPMSEEGGPSAGEDLSTPDQKSSSTNPEKQAPEVDESPSPKTEISSKRQEEEVSSPQALPLVESQNSPDGQHEEEVPEVGQVSPAEPEISPKSHEEEATSPETETSSPTDDGEAAPEPEADAKDVENTNKSTLNKPEEELESSGALSLEQIPDQPTIGGAKEALLEQNDSAESPAVTAQDEGGDEHDVPSTEVVEQPLPVEESAQEDSQLADVEGASPISSAQDEPGQAVPDTQAGEETQTTVDKHSEKAESPKKTNQTVDDSAAEGLVPTGEMVSEGPEEEEPAAASDKLSTEEGPLDTSVDEGAVEEAPVAAPVDDLLPVQVPMETPAPADEEVVQDEPTPAVSVEEETVTSSEEIPPAGDAKTKVPVETSAEKELAEEAAPPQQANEEASALVAEDEDAMETSRRASIDFLLMK